MGVEGGERARSRTGRGDSQKEEWARGRGLEGKDEGECKGRVGTGTREGGMQCQVGEMDGGLDAGGR